MNMGDNCIKDVWTWIYGRGNGSWSKMTNRELTEIYLQGPRYSERNKEEQVAAIGICGLNARQEKCPGHFLKDKQMAKDQCADQEIAVWGM